jgi:hypothetical protein
MESLHLIFEKVVNGKKNTPCSQRNSGYRSMLSEWHKIMWLPTTTIGWLAYVVTCLCVIPVRPHTFLNRQSTKLMVGWSSKLHHSVTRLLKRKQREWVACSPNPPGDGKPRVISSTSMGIYLPTVDSIVPRRGISRHPLRVYLAKLTSFGCRYSAGNIHADLRLTAWLCGCVIVHLALAFDTTLQHEIQILPSAAFAAHCRLLPLLSQHNGQRGFVLSCLAFWRLTEMVRWSWWLFPCFRTARVLSQACVAFASSSVSSVCVV